MRSVLAACLLTAAVQLRGAIDITLTVPEGIPTAANPLGAGYMLNWFERGITDALNHPDVGRQLSAVLHQLHATGLRFPGGAFTYFYPDRKAGLAAFKQAGFAPECYNLWHPETWGWASEQAFFEFCARTRITAWYEINPAYLYDARNNVIGQFADLPRRKAKRKTVLDPDTYLPLALEKARQRVRLAAKCGADVVWEIGNEDYIYFEPEGYAHIAAAFIRSLRREDPHARVAVCGDSENWSTNDWQKRMLAALADEGIIHLDFASVHLYLAGVGEWHDDHTWHPLPKDTAEHLYSSTVRAYQLIRGMYGSYRRILAAASYPDTRLALTETNPVTPNTLPASMRPYEHCLARALGEATNYPFMLSDFAAIFFHDLCRNGPDAGDFFRRIQYDPNAVQRYTLPLEAQIMGRVCRHARGKILYRDWRGICISKHRSGLYATAVNPDKAERVINLRLTPAATFATGTLEAIVCPSLQAVDAQFTIHREKLPAMQNGKLVLHVPPFSFVACTLAP